MAKSVLDRFLSPDEFQDQALLAEEFLNALEQGDIRCAYKVDGTWRVDERVKAGILRAFALGKRKEISIGPLTFADKHNLMPRTDFPNDVRIVPGGVSVRRGAYLGRGVIIMPPAYVNVGAYVDDGVLVDSHALVGSCAQIGKRVHISAGAQVGGVLEPINALPVIIEDDVLVGGNCGLYEGCVIKEKAVIGAGVILTRSVKIFDLVNETIVSAGADGVLCVPKEAVVVPGARSLNSDFAKKHGLALQTPLIIKYRDAKTDSKASLEMILR